MHSTKHGTHSSYSAGCTAPPTSSGKIPADVYVDPLSTDLVSLALLAPFLPHKPHASGSEFFAACLGLILFCFLREAVNIYRTKILPKRNSAKRQRKSLTSPLISSAAMGGSSGSSASADAAAADMDDDERPLALKAHHQPSSSIYIILADSAVYALSVAIAYLLMLVIMTYNIGMCLVVVFGHFLAKLTLTWAFQRHQRAAWEKEA